MQSTFRYDVHAGTSGDNFSDIGILPFEWESVQGITRILEMKVWDANAYIMLSYEGILWGPEIELDIDDPPVQIPHAARAMQIRNVTVGANSRYQIVGYW